MMNLMRTCSLIACAVVGAMSVQVGFAAAPPSRAPTFTGKLAGEAPPPDEALSLWYREPADAWTSALPVGNGRQGAMMYGGIDAEVLSLNENTLWAGGPYTPDNPAALAEHLRRCHDIAPKTAEELSGVAGEIRLQGAYLDPSPLVGAAASGGVSRRGVWRACAGVAVHPRERAGQQEAESGQGQGGQVHRAALQVSGQS